jgi:DNA-directed RNA polymerase subunit M/transcription elongation factor TFIIS
MTDSIMDAFECNQCGAQYDSEKELLEHRQAAHHAQADTHDHEPREAAKEKPGKPEELNQHERAKSKNA